MKHSTTRSQGYHMVGKDQRPLRVNKEAEEQHRQRLLEVLKVMSFAYIVLGALTTALGLVLVCFALERPRFTISTGLPLIIGLLQFIGSLDLCFIAVRGARVDKHSFSETFKWHFVILCVSYLGVIILGCASVLLSVFENQDKMSLIHNPSKTPVFLLGVVTTLFIILDFLGVTGTGAFFSVYQRHLGSGPMADLDRAMAEHQRQEHMHNRLMSGREMLVRDHSGRVIGPAQRMPTSVIGHNHVAEPQVDRKGYYVWNAPPVIT